MEAVRVDSLWWGGWRPLRVSLSQIRRLTQEQPRLEGCSSKRIVPWVEREDSDLPEQSPPEETPLSSHPPGNTGSIRREKKEVWKTEKTVLPSAPQMPPDVGPQLLTLGWGRRGGAPPLSARGSSQRRSGNGGPRGSYSS